MTELIIGIIVGVVVGFIIAYLYVNNKLVAVNTQNKMLASQMEQAKNDAASQLEQVKADASLQLSQTETRYQEQLKCQHDQSQEQLADLRQQYQDQLKTQQENNEKNMTAFREQLENDTRKLLQQRQEELQKGNSVQLDAILNPFKDKLAEMKKAFEENKESNARNSSAFDKQMAQMLQQSQQLGLDAQHLTEALKNNGKVQGDWGEQLLSTILENSGLRKGDEFEVQENVKDAEGNNLRPDVIVNCPDGNRVIIDSKVSLTGFYNYISASNDEERQKAEKENLDSVKKHVKELVEKDYSKLITGAVKTVLMFIPNEGSYILALQKDPNLANDAFRKGVLIINPTNLMLALHLIVQLWQFDRKEDNDRKIVDAATAMYEKFCTFAETFEKVGTQLATVEKTYEQARGQLNEGKGNLIKKIDNLQNMGVTSGKSIPKTLQTE